MKSVGSVPPEELVQSVTKHTGAVVQKWQLT